MKFISMITCLDNFWFSIFLLSYNKLNKDRSQPPKFNYNSPSIQGKLRTKNFQIICSFYC
ncbi:hypothetical protein IC582_008379 [Cucumis melo]